MQDTESYYVIGHLVQFTGLSDRTIRNYISSGILNGELINGMWHFTPDQVEAFVRHPSVRPSILAKQNGLVYDFLLDSKKMKQEVCVILDLPGEDRKSIAEYFCYTITAGNYHDIRFSFDGVNNVPRVFLRGDSEEVLRLMNAFYDR